MAVDLTDPKERFGSLRRAIGQPLEVIAVETNVPLGTLKWFAKRKDGGMPSEACLSAMAALLGRLNQQRLALSLTEAARKAS
ncbi:hypothetical protein [Chenggangzhangella methanolivorans]|uniref:Uncharacterized protein n=1 Tax=Chenggangzhangella methanolivorans TaxID=1437009 RepID=A0A9E6UM34_9HYPH|nr:hypothetical protein [Chenggangzhangella methanolivorans]QZN99640.1 hypothetical protein K6K41_23570 [Chenggangzhangella methanolivorans]